MQPFPSQPTHYLPLLSLFFLNMAGASLSHQCLLAFQLLLRPSITQNYCNAAVSIILTPLILLFNLHDCSSVIFWYFPVYLRHSSSNFLSMQESLLLDWRFWLFTA